MPPQNTRIAASAGAASSRSISSSSRTREVGRTLLSPDDGKGDRLESELWLRPGATVVGTHVHDSIAERFEVVSGVVGFHVDGRRQEGGPGTAVDIPAGVVHDAQNDTARPVKLLGVYVVEKGKPLATPAP